MPRQLVVVDVETTGLADNAVILEVAAVNVTTGDEFYFAPHVSQEELVAADMEAMAINRYYERRVWSARKNPHDTELWYGRLRTFLFGNTFGGSNPRFDAGFVAKKTGEVWHHRLADLAAYAAPALSLAPNEMVGLSDICSGLDVTNQEEHSALGDARATAECFRVLTNLYRALKSGGSL